MFRATGFSIGALLLFATGCDQIWIPKDRLENYDKGTDEGEEDCNDFDPSVHSNAVEICDGIDNDCDGLVDDLDIQAEDDIPPGEVYSGIVYASTDPIFYEDRDRDGFGDPGLPKQRCAAPENYVEAGTDCDDLAPDVGAPNTWYPDDDADGFGDSENQGTTSCVQPDTDWVPNKGDCNDEDDEINPGVTEGNCEEEGGEGAQDFNCDGQVGYQDNDEDGYLACNDCNDNDENIHKDAEEICDGLDNDCSGVPDDLSGEGSVKWYPDHDGDGYIVDDENLSGYNCDWYPGWAAEGNLADCDDYNAEIGPELEWYTDADGDSYGDESGTPALSCEAPSGMVATNADCDDANPGIHPGAVELCGNAVDENCDGALEQEDGDGDGFDACVDDCDDSDPSVNPSGVEICDGIDNDCSGDVDDTASDMIEWFVDADGDGFGEAGSAGASACSQPSGYAGNDADCDDTDATLNPQEVEVCDYIDNDCDGDTDEADASLDPALLTTFYADADGDGYGDATISDARCFSATGLVEDDSDCNDADDTVYPQATELCDGQDNDCDGDSSVAEQDIDSDGYIECTLDAGGWDAPTTAPADGDCDDNNAAANPGTLETCTTPFDDNCDGVENEDTATDVFDFYRDADVDGFGDASQLQQGCTEPTGYVSDDTDCDDGNSFVNPGATEQCDSVDTDEDCDGAADDSSATGQQTWYTDDDADGHGDPNATTTQACDPPAQTGYSLANDDCDDTDDTVYPGASLLCDGLDNDCADNGSGPLTDNEIDSDSDGFVACTIDSGGWDGALTSGFTSMGGDDCDGANAAAYPGNTEVCDLIDNNCDGTVDEGHTTSWYSDADGDGYGDSTSTPMTGCSQPPDFVADATDCDDGNAAVHPGAASNEPTLCTADLDGDGWGEKYPNTPNSQSWDTGSDCQDDPSQGGFDINPNATEVCDSLDNDCDGIVDEDDASDAQTWYADTDSDGHGDAASTTTACDQPSGYVDTAGDCDDTAALVYPGRAVYEDTLCTIDADFDGYGDASPTNQAWDQGSDCDDNDNTINPDATEVCDGLDTDEDCNGLADNDDSSATGTTLYYADIDGDGYGDEDDLGTGFCDDLEGYSTTFTDCDDDDTTINVDADEGAACEDGADNDCDGDTDCGDSDCAQETACTSGTYNVVAASPDCYCTLDTTGRIECVCNAGIGTDLSKTTSSQGYIGVPIGTFTALGVATDVACALNTSGEIKCWGKADNEIYLGSPSDFGWSGLTVGDSHACAISPSGDVTCWGVCTYGSDPHCGTLSNWCDSAPLEECGTTDQSSIGNGMMSSVVDLAVSENVTCVSHLMEGSALSTASIQCWGDGAQVFPTGPANNTLYAFDYQSNGDLNGCGLMNQPSYGVPQCWDAFSFTPPPYTFSEYYDSDINVDGLNSEAIDCGVEGCCAIRELDGNMICWDVPGVSPETPGPFISIGVGRDYAVGVLSTGVLIPLGTVPSGSGGGSNGGDNGGNNPQ